MLLALALAGCTDDEKRPDVPGDDDDDTTPALRPCVSDTMGASAIQLAHDGVIVRVPAGAVPTGANVELCTDGEAPGFVPASLVAEITSSAAPVAPLSIEVPYAAGAGLALWAEDAGGALVRQLRAIDAGGSFEAPLYRTGAVLVAPDDRVLEPYWPTGRDLVDLLFVVDNSCSMQDEQQQLVDEFPSFLAAFDAFGRDWHVGVTSTDLDYTYSGSKGTLRTVAGAKWIDPATEDPAVVFEQMALMGTTGSGTEQGLGAAFLALEQKADTTNAGFLRDDAQLAVVVVSEEPDLTRASTITADEFVDWFEELKGDPGRASFHSLVDLNLGDEYVDVSDAVGGAVLGIGEDDWTPLLEGLLDRLDADRQVLSWDAAGGTVEVWLLPADGSEPSALAADTFVFDDATNTLAVLDGAVPDGDEAVVLYRPE